MTRFGALLVASTLAMMPAAARAQDAVKIGILNDQSGNYAEFGGLGSVEAAKLAIEDFGGSVLGKPIEIVSADHQNKPDIAVGLARRWYDVDGVTAIADLTNSAVALGVAGIAKEKQKIALYNGPATTRLFNEDCSPTGFMWTFDTATSAKGTAVTSSRVERNSAATRSPNRLGDEPMSWPNLANDPPRSSKTLRSWRARYASSTGWRRAMRGPTGERWATATREACTRRRRPGGGSGGGGGRPG